MNIDLDYHPIQKSNIKLSIKILDHLWRVVNYSIFRVFPNQIKKPRVFLLRLFGAQVASTVNINRTAIIDHPWNLKMGHLSSLGDNSWAYCLDKITIGKKCCIGKDVYLLTGSHDVTDKNFELVTKPIVIKDGSWISTGAYILPGVIINEFSVVAAQSVVVKSTEAFSINGGNPAKFLKERIIKE